MLRSASSEKRVTFQTNYSYGYGFVEYENPDDADRAIEQLNGLQVHHKNIKVSFARAPGQDIKNTNLYIVNLPRYIRMNQT